MKKKSIILHSDDIPCVQDLVHTISRLQKDYKLLSKMRGTKDIEDPAAFRVVTSFLEMLISREKRNLSKEPEMVDDTTMEILMNVLYSHFEESDDRTIEAIEKTGLGDWARNYANKSDID